MGDIKLKMNNDKTELLAIGTSSKLSQVIPNLTPMSISGCDILFIQSVTNLGFYLDEASRYANTTALPRTLQWLLVMASIQNCSSLFSVYLSEQYVTTHF